MIEKLKELQNNSYAPYSNYRVSAIVVMKDEKEFSGVNVENASYGATVCAERVAIFNAISKGYKKNDFKELHLLVSSGKIGMPCFICRQVISEFFNKDMKVYAYNTKGEFVTHTVGELCNFPFGSDDLE